MKPAALTHLLQEAQVWRGSAIQPTASTSPGISSGHAALDAELPDRGWPANALCEILSPAWGLGELTLLMPALARLSAQSRWQVWIAPPWTPYAPGLVQAGIDLEQIRVVQPQNPRDALWAFEESLRSGACSAVLGWCHPIQPPQIKRLQLAAQQGECWGVLLRPQTQARNPSPAPLRIALARHQTRLNVQILKRRGGWQSDWLPVCPHAKRRET